MSVGNTPLRSGLGAYIRSSLGVRGGVSVIIPTAWVAIDDDLTGSEVYAFESYDSELYVGGNISNTLISETYRSVAKWDGDSWIGVGSWLYEAGLGAVFSVRDLHVHNNALYAGGDFVRDSAGTTLDNVAQYDAVAEDWLAVGSGFNGIVHTLTTYNGDLYAGGQFTENGDADSMDYVAKYDTGTSEWVAVGSGFDAEVRALHVHNDELYAAGDFTQNGAATAMKGVAKYDTATSEWIAVGSGLTNGDVYALHTHSGSLYAGGSFIDNGDLDDMLRVAKYDPDDDWIAVGSGFNATVHDLHTHGTQLYAAGAFTENGNGDSMLRVAQWSGSEWAAVGSGFNDEVNVLHSHENTASEQHMYAGGEFTQNGDTDPMNLAAKGIDP